MSGRIAAAGSSLTFRLCLAALFVLLPLLAILAIVFEHIMAPLSGTDRIMLSLGLIGVLAHTLTGVKRVQNGRWVIPILDCALYFLLLYPVTHSVLVVAAVSAIQFTDRCYQFCRNLLTKRSG